MPELGRSKIGFEPESWPNMTGEPHLTSQVTGEKAPRPYANTNYTWSRPTEQAISELEAHITKLQERRQKHAQEAELLWNWLSRKEQEFYNIPSIGGAESDDKIAARRYVEVVGNVHTKVWAEASHCDWMIADSRKRIEQLRSQRTPEGKVTWMPGISATASQAKPEFSMLLFRHFLEDSDKRKKALEDAKKGLEAALSRQRLAPANTVPNVKTGEAVSMQQVTRELLKSLETQYDAVKLDAEVTAKVVADARRLPVTDENP